MDAQILSDFLVFFLEMGILWVLVFLGGYRGDYTASVLGPCYLCDCVVS